MSTLEIIDELLEDDFELEDEERGIEDLSKPQTVFAGSDAVPFVHLHCHSHYSLLDGAAKIDQLVNRAVELGMPALAITDHGNLYGTLEFYQKAKEKGLPPILGYEAYVAPHSRFDRSAELGKSAFHLTLLAANKTGYLNLLKLSSSAYLDGFYYKPRIDKKVLSECHEGLICLSGCASSEFSHLILDGESDGMKRAKAVASWYRELFGDRYYIELQDHGLAMQQPILEGALAIARELGIPTVATNDVHYLTQRDSETQDLLLCVNTGKLRAETKRMRMDSDQFFFRSGSEMLRALPHCEDAVRRTVEVAERCQCDLELGRRFFPVFTPPEGETSDELLRRLCIEGLNQRYKGNTKRIVNGELSEEVMNRLNRELSVIQKLGFANYFLIVWDFVRVAEERGIHRTARGSGVGALVCFALNMSHVCPLEFDLLFERFLDENRVEAPDIDIDFDQLRRGEILDYVKEKYGEKNVAQIGTFGTIAAKSSIKDVGRVLGIPLGMVNDITKLVPEAPKMTIKKAFDQNEELRQLYDSNSDVREVVDYARQIEGLARSAGTHACAVVIADTPLTDYVPLQKVSGKDEIVTQWSMGDVEKAGLLKMDFLGLRNLSILDQAIALVKETKNGEEIDPYHFPLDDKETFALLCRGETKGVFQLEGGGIRELLQRMKPDNFRDIIATLALYRPGPLEGGMVDQYVDVKHRRKEAVYLHPVMKDVLEETNGVMVYQEQVMRILNRLGKIPLSSSYTCIKAIGKKKEEQINKFQGDFIQGAQENGLSKEQAEDLFEMIKKFAGYGFNKSHSTAYALIAYMTAYLKSHYPVEFMGALLCGDITGRNFSKRDATVEHIEDCARMNIKVIPPDVNHSFREYKVRNGEILFGLSAIKGCGDSAADAIRWARETGGPFLNMFDFCERIDTSQCPKATIESLIKAGAFDSLCVYRSQLIQMVDRAIKAGQSAVLDRQIGQKNLFGGVEEEPIVQRNGGGGLSIPGLPDIPEWIDQEKSGYEKEVLGFYMSTNPFQQHEKTLSQYRTHTIYDGVRLGDRTEVLLGGIISDIKLSQTKNPKPGKPSQFAMFTLEDTGSTIRALIWPEQYQIFSSLVKDEKVVFAKGRIDRSRSQNEDDANLIIDELIAVEEADSKLAVGLSLLINETPNWESLLKNLHELLRGFPGRNELQMQIRFQNGKMAELKCSKMGITVNPELRHRLDDLLGQDCYRMLPRTNKNRKK